MLLLLLGVVAFAGASTFVAVWAYQRHGVYRFDQSPGDPAAIDPAVRVVTFPAEDGHLATAWVAAPRPGQPVLISFHGNFTAVGPAAARLQPLLARGFGLAVLVYRGSAGTGGTPGEAAFAADARALYDRLDQLLGEPVPAARRVLHGMSLGSSVAAGLAADRPAAGIVLEASFDTCCRWHSSRLFGLPMQWLMWRERHDVAAKLRGVVIPKLILHGRADDAVPLAWAQALHDAVQGDKRLIVYERGGHADLAAHGALDDIAAFAAGLR